MPRIINSNTVSLVNLGRGEMIKRFDEAFDLLLANVKDTRTPATKTREIVIKAKVTPSQERDEADLTVEVTTKFAAVDPYYTQIVIGERINGRPEAHEAIRNPDLPADAETLTAPRPGPAAGPVFEGDESIESENI